MSTLAPNRNVIRILTIPARPFGSRRETPMRHTVSRTRQRNHTRNPETRSGLTSRNRGLPAMTSDGPPRAGSRHRLGALTPALPPESGSGICRRGGSARMSDGGVRTRAAHLGSRERRNLARAILPPPCSSLSGARPRTTLNDPGRARDAAMTSVSGQGNEPRTADAVRAISQHPQIHSASFDRDFCM
jgi:hypothetical protein